MRRRSRTCSVRYRYFADDFFIDLLDSFFKSLTHGLKGRQAKYAHEACEDYILEHPLTLLVAYVFLSCLSPLFEGLC